MKRKEVLRKLIEQGCIIRREGAKHTVIDNPIFGGRAVLPRHTEIKEQTLRKILKRLGLNS